MSGNALLLLLEDDTPARRRQGMALLRSLGEPGARQLLGVLRDDARRWSLPALRLTTLAALARAAGDEVRQALSDVGEAPALVADAEDLAGTGLQAALKLLPALRALTLVRTAAGSLAPLAVARELRELTVHARGFLDLEPLAGLPALEVFRLRGKCAVEAPSRLPPTLRELSLNGQVRFPLELLDVVPEGLESLDFAHASAAGTRDEPRPLPALRALGVSYVWEVAGLAPAGVPSLVRIGYVGEDDAGALATLAAGLPRTTALRIDRYRPEHLDDAVAERLVAVGDVPAAAAEWLPRTPRLVELSPGEWPFPAELPEGMAATPASVRKAAKGALSETQRLRFAAHWRALGYDRRLASGDDPPAARALWPTVLALSGAAHDVGVSFVKAYLAGRLENLSADEARSWAGVLRAAGARPRATRVGAGGTPRETDVG
ncbi:MAG: hypothetical protein AAGH15_13600 [Myxococcota bacterium]